MSSLYKKACKKLAVLARLSNLMSIKQKSFNEIPCWVTVWLLSFNMDVSCSEVNNKINYLHERSLRRVYKDNNSFFKELLKKDNSFTVDHRNIQSLAIELFKVKANLSNTIMSDIFQTRTLTCNLKQQTNFARGFVNTSRFDLNSFRFHRKKGTIAPSDNKNASNLHIFKNKIRTWKLNECYSDLYRPYISNLGLVNLV